jgi:hypothetical protein
MGEVDKLGVEEIVVYPTTPLTTTSACLATTYNNPEPDSKATE